MERTITLIYRASVGPDENREAVFEKTLAPAGENPASTGPTGGLQDVARQLLDESAAALEAVGLCLPPDKEVDLLFEVLLALVHGKTELRLPAVVLEEPKPAEAPTGEEGTRKPVKVQPSETGPPTNGQHPEPRRRGRPKKNAPKDGVLDGGGA